MNGLTLSNLAFLTAAQNKLSQNLLGWWKLDDGSGTTAIDSGTGANNGTLIGSPTWVSGRVGSNALSFNNASSQYVSLGTPSNLNISFPLSICGWVNRNITTQYSVVMARRTTGTLQYQLTWVKSNEGTNQNKIRLDLWTATGITSFNSTLAYTNSGWHHIAGTYDGINVVLYFDGAVAGSTPETRSISLFSVPNRIGNDNSSSPDGYMSGTLDDVRIYNRALLSSEVATLASM